MTNIKTLLAAALLSIVASIALAQGSLVSLDKSANAVVAKSAPAAAKPKQQRSTQSTKKSTKASLHSKKSQKSQAAEKKNSKGPGLEAY
jgi:hypothetical protein